MKHFIRKKVQMILIHGGLIFEGGFYSEFYGMQPQVKLAKWVCLSILLGYYQDTITFIYLRTLMANSIRGVVPSPPNGRKMCIKNAKYNSYDFLQVLSKSSWTTFKTIFETLSALELCHVTIIVGAVYTVTFTIIKKWILSTILFFKKI